MNTASLEFLPDGTCQGLYTEVIELSCLGKLAIQRLTSVEFDNQTQLWRVLDLQGRCVHTSASRGECLRWEQGHFGELVEID